jgi:flagellar hook-associated protein 3 FlgL
MTYRVTDSSQTAIFNERINMNRVRVETAREHISTGKRINRPSDDPFGADAVLRLRTSLSTIDQFKENSNVAKENLQVSDGAVESYQQLLDHARALLSQGASDSTSPANKASIASEIDSIRKQALSIANLSSGGRYLFGGTRQSAAPYDSNGVPSAIPTQSQMVQLEPGAYPVASDVPADSIFANGAGTVFATLANAATALRGTGNTAADQATVLGSIDSLTGFTDQSSNGRAQLGASLHGVDEAQARLESMSLSYQRSVDQVESADIAESALELTQADQALQATLQATSAFGRRSLLDFLT